MIDAYDALNLPPDCKQEEVKKAYHRMSLQYHPDKVGGSREAEERFKEISDANEILKDADRRKVYDTFGIDLGAPEMEVFNLTFSTLCAPTGLCLLKTVIARLVLWIIDFVWIGRLLMLLGLVCLGLFLGDVKMGEDLSGRKPEAVAIFGNVLVIDAIVFLNWLWPLLADGAAVFYLAMETLGLIVLLAEGGWKIGVGGYVVALIIARLLRGWWFWIVGLEVLALGVLFLSAVLISGIMRMWMDTVQQQHGEKLRAQRLALRAERQKKDEEIQQLKDKLAQSRGKS
eukprot:TRINITY_DN9108_c0_g1_i1.p1 TRINITY_DN9108_c0_g1~~TRINITY_DN9108_c0_g1_i1.p1  ORF type:complete len:286 (+),score=52.45 TRINITY_DN9108_c0_g1_i1:91-948(+)